MNKKNQSYDRYFKENLQNVELVKLFLNIHLDQDILEEIAWETLALYDTPLIGNKGKQLSADVLYRALAKGDESEMFFMFNHECNPSELFGIDIEGYILETVHKSVHQKKQPALVLCFTIYTGSGKPSPHPKEILDYYEDRELDKKILFNSHRLIDLSSYSDETLSQHGILGAAELLMKHIDNPDLLNWIRSNPSVLQRLESGDLLTSSVEYLVDAGYHAVEDLLTLFEEISPKCKEVMLTTRQQIERKSRKEGKQEGIELGIETKSFEVACYMLKDSMPKEKISVWTGLDPEEIEKLVRELNLRM